MTASGSPQAPEIVSKKSAYEIGDRVVFANGKDMFDCSVANPRWKTAKVTDIAESLIEVEFRSLFGFYRRKWICPGTRWLVNRKDRAEELISRYQSAP